MAQNTKRNWKLKRSTSVRHGIELNVAYGQAERGLSVARIADLMGMPSHYTLYKQMESGRMPAILIPAFENACGANFLTQYLAHTANKLLVEIPAGRRATHMELNEIGAFAHTVLGMLISFYEGGCDQGDLEGALATLIEDLAYQRRNVAKHHQPELMFGGGS